MAALRRFGAVALLTLAPVAFAGSQDPATAAITTFEAATQEYALMHRRLEQNIGSIELGRLTEEINRIISELATAIRLERVGAKDGDFFGAPLGDVLRTRIHDALLTNHYTVAELRAASRVSGVDYDRVKLRVNDTFPLILGVPMLRCVFNALPSLPPELQYRIVDDDLVLIDVHALIVVDILPGVLTDDPTVPPRDGSGR
jgi:hypothetical protein